MDEPAGGHFQVTSSASAMLRMVLESHTLCESSRPVKADVPLTRNSTACPIALLNHLPEVPDLATPAGAFSASTPFAEKLGSNVQLSILQHHAATMVILLRTTGPS